MLDDLITVRARGGFLEHTSDEDLQRFAELLSEGRAAQGETLKRAGERCDEAYVVLEGRLRIGEPTSPLARAAHQEFEAGDLVAGVHLATGAPHEGDLHCVGDCRFARLTRENFDRLMEICPELWSAIHGLALRVMRRTFLTRHLNERFGPFGNLLQHVVREFEADATWMALGSGETLFEAGSPADHLYLVMTGRLLVGNMDSRGHEKVQRTIAAGGIVGEAALLMNIPHSHAVFAGRDSELVRLPRSSFLIMLERSSSAVLHVSRLLAERLKGVADGRGSRELAPRCLGVVPAASNTPVDVVVGALERALGEVGPVTVLTSGSVDRALGVPGISLAKDTEPAYLRLVQWLQQTESEGGYLIYQADATWTEWSERCARHTDRVVVVADSAERPGLGDLERRMDAPRRHWGLVLLHAADTDRPRNTSTWLDGSRVEDVFHVRRGNEKDFARLARLLSGRAVGLVLGGGGARGFAHLGVWRALEELGVTVDMVGGTSIGAALAAYPAKGMGYAESVPRIRRAFQRLADYSLPWVAFVRGRRAMRAIEAETGTWDIEDFWLPFFCLSTNLSRAEAKVHTRGCSARAIRTTLSLPGILPPVSEGGEVHVDGAVINNLPIDIMRERNPFGTIIAVDVAAPTRQAAHEEWPLHISGWHIALKRLLPWCKTPRVPVVASTILQSIMVGSVQARQVVLRAKLADQYLNMRVPGVGVLDFEDVEDIAQAGYDESIDELRGWVSGLAR